MWIPPSSFCLCEVEQLREIQSFMSEYAAPLQRAGASEKAHLVQVGWSSDCACRRALWPSTSSEKKSPFLSLSASGVFGNDWQQKQRRFGILECDALCKRCLVTREVPKEAELSLPMREPNCRACTALRFLVVIRVTVCQLLEMSSLESLAQLKKAWEWRAWNPANYLAPSQTSQPEFSQCPTSLVSPQAWHESLSPWAVPNSCIFGHWQTGTCH